MRKIWYSSQNQSLLVPDDSVGQPTPSSLQRGCWPTSWGSCWWFSVCCWATWSPRTNTDAHRTRRKNPCPSTSRPSPRASPRPRLDPRVTRRDLSTWLKIWRLSLSEEESTGSSSSSSSSQCPLCCKCFIQSNCKHLCLLGCSRIVLETVGATVSWVRTASPKKKLPTKHKKQECLCTW